MTFESVESVTSHRRARPIWLAVAVFARAQTQPVDAQIYEWTDEEKVSHFANSLEEVPPDEREQAKVIIGASTQPEPAPAPAARDRETQTEQAAEEVEADEARSDFTAGWEAGFEAGFIAGRQAALAEQPICPAEPAVVVLQSRSPVIINAPPLPPERS